MLKYATSHKVSADLPGYQPVNLIKTGFPHIYRSGKLHFNYRMRIGYDGEDFARNLYTVLVENDVLKVPRFFKLIKIEEDKTKKKFEQYVGYKKNRWGRSARRKRFEVDKILKLIK